MRSNVFLAAQLKRLDEVIDRKNFKERKFDPKQFTRLMRERSAMYRRLGIVNRRAA